MVQAPNTKILQLLKRTLEAVSISKEVTKDSHHKMRNYYGRIINIHSQVHTGVLVTTVI